jgi:hypothetical protein
MNEAWIAVLAGFAFLGLCKLVALMIRAASDLMELPNER